jgi:hypothetical protein
MNYEADVRHEQPQSAKGAEACCRSKHSVSVAEGIHSLRRIKIKKATF